MLRRLPFLLFLLPYLLFVFFTYRHYGVAIDEPMEYGFGEMLYNRNFGHDPQLMHDFSYEGQDSREIWSHNHFHAMLLYLFNDSAQIDGYHLYSLLFSILGFYLFYEFMLQVTSKPIFGLLGSTLLFFTPRFLGDLASNVKDPPFSIYYLVGLLAIFLAPKIKPLLLRLLVVGLALGLAAAFRTVGYGLVPIYLLYRFSEIYLSHKPIKGLFFLQPILELIIIIPLILFVHGLEMPFIASNPFAHLRRLFTIATDFPWEGTILYYGQPVSATHLPWHYLPGWLIVITPVFTLLFSLLSVKFFFRHPLYRLLHFSVLVNLALYFILKPVIYDGIRHFLFLQVILALLAALTWVKCYQLKSLRRFRPLLILVLVLHLFLTSFQYFSLHPYEYVYFNEVAGFLPGAANRFETDYWGTSYAEASRWLIQFLGPESTATVGLCGNNEASVYFRHTSIQTQWLPQCLVDPANPPDYVFAYSRWGEWNRVPGTVIYTVSRLGVPLMKIFMLE